MKSQFYIKYLLYLAFMFSTILCLPDSIPDTKSIINALSNKGYENLFAIVSEDTIYIAYENRKYRWECKAIIDIIHTLIPLSESCKELCIIPQYMGIPIIQITINIGKYLEFIKGKTLADNLMNSIHISFDIDNFQKQLKNKPVNNPSFNKLDIVIHPQFRAQFGNYSDPLESQINISPAINVSFWKGMKLTTQIIFPLQNDLEKEGDYIRPGLLTINQMFRLPLNSFGSVSVGYFTKNRYGANLETKKFLLNGKIALGLNLGYTGFANVMKGRWTYSEIDLLTWNADIAYRYAKYDLALKLGYGSYLNKDKGFRFDFYRQFGEVSIGFFAIKSNGVLNGGFNFCIPIPPRKYNTKRIVRIRPASYFNWQYRAKGLPKEGRTFKADNSISGLLDNLNPNYIKKQLIKLLTNNY